MKFLWSLFEICADSFDILVRTTILGLCIGSAIGILSVILLHKLYFKKLPKLIKKKSGILLGAVLILASPVVGTVVGFTVAANNSVRAFIYSIENTIFSQIEQTTGIDLWASLDENFGISQFENELEAELLSLESDATTAFIDNYGEIYNSICKVYNTICPFYDIFSNAYIDYADLLNLVLDVQSIKVEN